MKGTINAFGLKASGTIGGSAMSAHIGGGFGIYFNNDGVNLRLFEHVGLGVGEKLGQLITIPVNLSDKDTRTK